MSKKVSELTKELDITLQELKDYASKMGIDIKSANSSVDDVDASRLSSTINLMRGNSSSAQTGSNKPKIKATPVINRDGAKARPASKPVIPKKAVVPPKKTAEAEEESAPAEAVPAAEAQEEKPAAEEKPAVPAGTEQPVEVQNTEPDSGMAEDNKPEGIQDTACTDEKPEK